MRIHALSFCLALLAAIASPQVSHAQKPGAISERQVDQSVITALSHQSISKLKVISHIDLTTSFATETQWTFVVVQEDGKSPTELEDHGPIHICLVKEGHPDCSEKFYPQSGNEDPWFQTPYHLFAGKVVYAGQNRTNPLLFIQLCGAEGINGNCGIATALYRYDRAADRFVRVFLNLTGRNNNEETSFVESGPLQGDVLVAYPTGNAPYTYWIEVYRAADSGQYTKILRYRGRTHYNDGNRLAVTDSDMPGILSRLGLWKTGDPLPVPAYMLKDCRHLYMRSGEEWCK